MITPPPPYVNQNSKSRNLPRLWKFNFDEKLVIFYTGYFSISFYTEILTPKVKLWIFFTCKKHRKTAFIIKISVLKNNYCDMWRKKGILTRVFSILCRKVKYVLSINCSFLRYFSRLKPPISKVDAWIVFTALAYIQNIYCRYLAWDV